MDGTPMLTQCPQSAYTTFQYKFRASAVGTHMYHAHSAADAADGLAGALIVRQSKRLDPLTKFYDVDATEHTIFISEWGHSMGPLAGIIANVPKAESLLINGKGRSTESTDAPLSKFEIEYGKRYRFRLVHGGGSKSCSIKLTIDKHIMKLIALDGHMIEAIDVYSIELNRGERADIILEGKQIPGVYKISVDADSSCQNNLHGEADLVYVNKQDKVLHKLRNSDKLIYRDFTSVTSFKCKEENVLCLDEIVAVDKIPFELAATLDEVIYVPFNYSTRRISAKRVGKCTN